MRSKYGNYANINVGSLEHNELEDIANKYMHEGDNKKTRLTKKSLK